MSGDHLSVARAVFDTLGWGFLDNLNLANDEHFQLVLQRLEAITAVNLPSCGDYDLARMRSLAAYYKAHKHNANWYEGLTVQKLLNWEPPNQQMAPPPPGGCWFFYSVYDSNGTQLVKGTRSLLVHCSFSVEDMLAEIRDRHRDILYGYPFDELSVQVPDATMLAPNAATSDGHQILDQDTTIQDLLQNGYESSVNFPFRIVTPLVSSNNDKMFRFFNDTKIEKLKFISGTQLINMPGILSLTGNPTNATTNYVLWRDCYTHILPSLVGGLETSLALTSPRSTRPAFVVTGNQGIGKSVLGAIVALFLHQCFGWTVNYYGSNDNECIMKGPKHPSARGKIVDIWDLSSTTAKVRNSDNLILVFSSCNSDRWRLISHPRQLEARSGSFIYLSPFSKQEIELFAEQMYYAHQFTEQDKNEFIYNYGIVGGIARYCNNSTSSNKKLMRGVMKRFSTSSAFIQAAKDLESMIDQPSEVGKKNYPGMLLHVMPIGREAHRFQLKFASELTEKLFEENQRNKNVNDINEILKSFQEVACAHGLAGVLFERWTNIVTDSSKFSIQYVGKLLPTAKHKLLFNIKFDAKDIIYRFGFDNFDDLEKRLSSAKTNLEKESTSSIAISAAKKSNQIAIDGAMLLNYKHNTTGFLLDFMHCLQEKDKKFELPTTDGQSVLVLVGIQLTTAGSSHPLKEKGVEKLQACGKAIGAAKTLIWFVQPKTSLEVGCIHNQQAHEFNDTKYKHGNDTVTKEEYDKGIKAEEEEKKDWNTVGKNKRTAKKEVPTKKKRAQNTTTSQPKWKKKASSNDESWWSNDAQVSQMVVFCRFSLMDGGADAAGTPSGADASVADMVNAFSQEQKEHADTTHADDGDSLEFRPREATIEAARNLVCCITAFCPGLTGLADSLIDHLVTYDSSNATDHEGLRAALHQTRHGSIQKESDSNTTPLDSKGAPSSSSSESTLSFSI